MEYKFETEKKIQIPEIFSISEESFNRSLRGIESVTAQSFKTNIQDFPYVPREIKPQLLFNLGVHFHESTLNTQRNFWAYLMLQCDVKTYKKFLDLHSKEIRERISPIC